MANIEFFFDCSSPWTYRAFHNIQPRAATSPPAPPGNKSEELVHERLGEAENLGRSSDPRRAVVVSGRCGEPAPSQVPHCRDGRHAARSCGKQRGRAPSPNCTIKGNINRKGERIYHMPSQRNYARVNMTDPHKRWFCTEEEAATAGWRPAAR
jgi:hypothetical protein